MARLFPMGGGLPVGMPLHLPIETTPRNCVLLDGSPMPEWARQSVKDMYGATLPDYRGRTPVGTNEGTNRIGASWGDNAGGAGGSDRHTLKTNEMPSHDHTGNTSTDWHTHGAPTWQKSTNVSTSSASSQSIAGASNETGRFTSSPRSWELPGDSHNHSFQTNNTGGSDSHNNMQPSIAGRWLMRVR